METSVLDSDIKPVHNYSLWMILLFLGNKISGLLFTSFKCIYLFLELNQQFWDPNLNYYFPT